MRPYERLAARLYRGETPTKGQPVQALAGGRTAPLDLPLPCASPELSRLSDMLLLQCGEPVDWAHASHEQVRLDSLMVFARSAYENHSVRHAVAAVDGLDAFMVGLRVGRGPAWSRPTDVAWRLIRFSLFEAYLGEEIDPGIRRLMAGAVEQHASWLHHQLMTSASSDLSENVVKASALVVAGRRWPVLREARRWWSEGLVILSREGGRMVEKDGSPRCGIHAHLSSFEALLCAWWHARSTHLSFPSNLVGVLKRSVAFLRNFEGPGRDLEAYGLGCVVGAGSESRLQRILRAAQWEKGVLSIGGSAWEASAYRQGGWIVAHRKTQLGVVSFRWALCDSAAGGVPVPEVVLGGVSVFPSGGLTRIPEGVDGYEIQSFQVEGDVLTARVAFWVGRQAWVRSVLVQGMRFFVEDWVEGSQGLNATWEWGFGAGWKSMGQSVLKRAERTVEVQLADSVEWELTSASPVVIAAESWVSATTRVRASFALK